MARKLDKPKPVDPRSTQELVGIMLATDEEEQANILYLLQKRGDREVFDAGCNLCQSADPKQRALGVWLLSQNGVAEKTMRAEVTPVFLKMIEKESHPDVLAGLGYAFGHLKVVEAVEPLSRLRNHPNADVRWNIVMGLLTQENEYAIKTLIELSKDENASVRDWATFGLGTQIDTDTSEIRHALAQRLDDPDGNTRGEALVGLAKRKDERVIEPLLKELTSGCVGSFALEAAQEMGSPRLLTALTQLAESGDVDADERLLQEAINSCKIESPSH